MRSNSPEIRHEDSKGQGHCSARVTARQQGSLLIVAVFAACILLLAYWSSSLVLAQKGIVPPTRTATSVPKSTARRTRTASPATPVRTSTRWPTPSQSGTATRTRSSPATPTRTPEPTQTLPTTGTPTGSVTLRPTATPTGSATLTPTVPVTGTLLFAITPRESSVPPGGRVSYTVAVTNTSASQVSVILATSDTLVPAFGSSLSKANLSLPPRGAGTITLTVSASAKIAEDSANVTTITAKVNGVERGHSSVTTRLLLVKFNRTFSGMGVSDHNVSPSTTVNVQIGVSSHLSVSSATLSDLVPRDWSVSNTGGGTVGVVNADLQKVEWRLGNLTAGTVVTRTYTLKSPALATPAPHQYQFYSALSVANQRVQGDPWPVLLQHPLSVVHFRVGRDTPLEKMTFVAPPDTPGRGLAPFQSFRVRFLVSNEQPAAIRWKPQLEWSTRADGGFQIVPPGRAGAGQPFYIRPLDGIANRRLIPPALFGLGPGPGMPQNGMIFTTENPAQVSVLNARSFTEIEFSVHAGVDAAYSTGYSFRLSDEGRIMTGKIARIETGAPPPLQLTQPQYPGVDAKAAGRAPARLATGPSPHGGYSNTADQCAACHRQHTARSRNLLAFADPQSSQCFTCHNGTGASTNVAVHYSDPSVPANNPTTSSFYSHPATTASSHTNAASDEFQGVLNRHSECSDCHNPHKNDTSLAAATASGFTASGAVQNTAGVSAGKTWKSAITYQYELCLKCHSSYTILLSYSKKSYMMLDQAAEFTPANASFHPVEGAGKNTTAAMAASLAGSSPYKLWNFAVGSVVRCENCHGDYRLATPATPPGVNALLAPHTSRYPYLLMNNYRDRVLKSSGENYSAADFALCYECHAEAPFVSGGGSSTATNFRLHSLHTSNIGGRSTSTDIDTPGAGAGRAICAECHYRVHGQGTNASGNPGGSRLVNFAPNVTASGSGQLKWDPATRTCYLTCHGDNHNPEHY